MQEKQFELDEVQTSELKEKISNKGKTIIRQHKKIGRNESCPCGSNRKYKHCCGVHYKFN